MNKIIASMFTISIFGFHTIGAMAGGQDPNISLLEGAMNGDLAQVQDALNRGANINTVDATNTTALNFAALTGSYDVADYLIDQGAQVNRADISGDTPLHNAVTTTSANIVKLLLDNGADPTVRNNNGQTPADILQTLDPEQQVESAAQEIRRYFTQAARPTPETAIQIRGNNYE